MKEIPSLNEVKKSIENFQKEKLLKISDFENIEDYINYFEKIFNSNFYTFHYMVQIQKPKNFLLNYLE